MGAEGSGATAASSRSLEREFSWAERIIETRLSLHFGHEASYGEVREIAPPELGEDDSPYAMLVRQHSLSFEQRFVLVLALAPQLRPQMLDPLRMKNANLDGYFAEFGGRHTGNRFLPTVQTVCFLLAGDDLAQRLALMHCFGEDSALCRAQLLSGIDAASESDQPLRVRPGFVRGLATGRFDTLSFPGRRLETSLDWDDLVLSDKQRADIEAIRMWIGHSATLLRDWGLAKRIPPGYRALFCGAPGTGKTLTASLLGKASGLPVCRVDLSAITSRYISGTASNIRRMFDEAERAAAILFFDEADALFGRRTEIRDSHDRYANIEVAWLLRQMEEFAGTVIVAANLDGDLDEALARRFQSIVHFPIPAAAERLRLWRQAFTGCALAPDIDLAGIAEEFEISGAAIANALRHACLMALRREDRTVQLADLRHSASAEFRKL